MSLVYQIFNGIIPRKKISQDLFQKHYLEFISPAIGRMLGIFIGLAIGSFLEWY